MRRGVPALVTVLGLGMSLPGGCEPSPATSPPVTSPASTSPAPSPRAPAPTGTPSRGAPPPGPQDGGPRITPPGVLAAGPPIDVVKVSLALSTKPREGGECPRGMVPLPDARAPRLCVDAYEDVAGGPLGNSDQGAGFPDGSTSASSAGLPGYSPTTGISWYQAYAVCQNDRKHLCTVAEWMYACDGVEGVEGSRYPWGDTPTVEGRCPLPDASGRPYLTAISPGGAWEGCASPQGVHDMLGNAWEWVDPGLRRPDGTPVAGKMGGGWYSGFDRASCRELPALEHQPSFSGSIGFRCCAEPLP